MTVNKDGVYVSILCKNSLSEAIEYFENGIWNSGDEFDDCEIVLAGCEEFDELEDVICLMVIERSTSMPLSGLCACTVPINSLTSEDKKKLLELGIKLADPEKLEKLEEELEDLLKKSKFVHKVELNAKKFD